jgi:hypothetical protein
MELGAGLLRLAGGDESAPIGGHGREAFRCQSLGEMAATYRRNMLLRRLDLLHVARRLQAIAVLPPAASAAAAAAATTEEAVVGAAADDFSAAGPSSLLFASGARASGGGGGGGGGGGDGCDSSAALLASRSTRLRFGGRLDTSAFGLLAHSYGAGTAWLTLCTNGTEATPEAEVAMAAQGPGAAIFLGPPPSAGAATAAALPPRASPGPPLWRAPLAAPEPRFSCMVGLDAWLWAVPQRYVLGPASGTSPLLPETVGSHAVSVDGAEDCDPFEGLAAFASGDAERNGGRGAQIVAALAPPATLLARASRQNAALRCAPTLLLCSEGWEHTAWHMPLWRGAAARHAHSTVWLLRGTSHLNFTDAPLLFNPHILRQARGTGAGPECPLRSMALQAHLAGLFFAAHLGRSVGRLPGGIAPGADPFLALVTREAARERTSGANAAGPGLGLRYEIARAVTEVATPRAPANTLPYS